MDLDGGNQRNLTNNSSADGLPAWSPDGRQIAFRSDRDGNSDIYVMDLDGGNQRNLTNNSSADGFPAWSPDGGQIAFHSDRDGNRDIYVMDSDSSSPRRLTNNSSSDGYPVWSPDGRQIAFRSDHNGNPEIYVMGADGSNPRRLTNNDAWDYSPAWRPVSGAAASPEVAPVAVTIGGQATITVEDVNGTLNRRSGAGINFSIIDRLPYGTIVTLVDGPQPVDGYTWWKVQTPNSVEGWVAENVNGIQTLTVYSSAGGDQAVDNTANCAAGLSLLSVGATASISDADPSPLPLHATHLPAVQYWLRFRLERC